MVVDLRNKPALSALLNSLKRMIPVAVERIDDRGEWILPQARANCLITD